MVLKFEPRVSDFSVNFQPTSRPQSSKEWTNQLFTENSLALMLQRADNILLKPGGRAIKTSQSMEFMAEKSNEKKTHKYRTYFLYWSYKYLNCLKLHTKQWHLYRIMFLKTWNAFIWWPIRANKWKSHNTTKNATMEVILKVSIVANLATVARFSKFSVLTPLKSSWQQVSQLFTVLLETFPTALSSGCGHDLIWETTDLPTSPLCCPFYRFWTQF